MTRFALGLVAFGAAFAQPGAVVEVVKNVEPAAIVLASTEHRGVMAAARDLQRDITKITGVTPNIVHALGASPGSYIVLGSADCPAGKALLASVGVSTTDLDGKWEIFKYRVVKARTGHRVLAIAGSNVRGTIYGVYDFEQRHLGVNPLWFWSDQEPPTRGELVFDSRIDYGPVKEPTWKYRGWSLNDHPQLIEWMESGIVHRSRYARYMFGLHPEVVERLIEAALRLRMNMFTWYFIDIEFQPDYERLRQMADRGLFITQHQMEGLGADVGFWDAYWRDHNPKGKPDGFSYRKTPEAFREFWTHYIKRWSEFSPQVVWESNLRGWADAAYTESTLPGGGTDRQKAEIINDALADQARLIRKHDPDPSAEIMTTLYSEMGAYYDQGWIKLLPWVTTGFADRGMSGMSYSKKFWTEPRDPKRRYGQYFHTNYFGGGPQVAKCTPIESYLKVNMDAMFQRGDTQHMLLAMNELRAQQIEIRGIAEMLWDYPAFQPREYLLRYCREEFGEAAAPKVAALYDTYYAKYPHKMVDDGFKKIPMYYKVMEPLFTVIGNLVNIENGTTDGLSLNYEYDRAVYERGIRDMGEVLEQARALRPSIPEDRRGFFDYEFIDSIRLIRGIYKLSIATQDAIARLKQGNRPAALAALLDARPMTEELYQGFRGQRDGEKWRYWYRSSTNKDFYLLYNMYQRARLRLEVEPMNLVTGIEPQRRPWLGNVVMHDPARAGTAVYSTQADRLNVAVFNGSPYSLTSFPLTGAFQIGGVKAVYGKGAWRASVTTDYGRGYRFRLHGRSRVYVAKQKGQELAWLSADGFTRTGETLEVGEWGWPYRYRNRPPNVIHRFELFVKDFQGGEVTLGDNIRDTGQLPYLVFVKPAFLAFENFRGTEPGSIPTGWDIDANGNEVAVVAVTDYAGELRPSAFDLTTVPRYTPVVLRGLKLAASAGSSGAAVATLRIAGTTTDDFVVNVRLKPGQNSERSEFSLCAGDRTPVVTVVFSEAGNITAYDAAGRDVIVAGYRPNRWYQIKLRVSPDKRLFSLAVQDDRLRTDTAEDLPFRGSMSGRIDRIVLSNPSQRAGSWVVYNAIDAYVQ
ncbi:MAG TPA: glycosyl hydrolase 115 family protein [Bryobacteraceae bacterium]|nr:glycosyl hydrolase 115 family protein [Bryobacteraceae bacterium]